ncbi:MAG: helix-turn-helix domain-containing protein [Actinobacteria bacterium]|nr:helix-turn-helix domain-containing protein [Actinomycetota bacterium]
MVVPSPAEEARPGAQERATRTHEALSHFGDAGSVLKAARVSRGYELTQVGAILGMRADFVAAMEEGRFDRLPGSGSYAPGMVARYAVFLDLEPCPLLERIPGALPRTAPSAVTSRPWAKPWGARGAEEYRPALWIRFAGGAMVVVGLVLAALALS